MSVVYNQIELNLIKTEKLLDQANRELNPGEWVYKNDLRTPLFMLEGLTRIYSSINPGRKLRKINERFKTVEDAIGLLDYYAASEKEFSDNKGVRTKIIDYIHGQRMRANNSLEAMLKADGWLNGKRIQKLRSRLTELYWIDKEAKEINALRESYLGEIETVKAFATGTKFVFKNVEADLHEMRRRIRWLSIYPQALGGIMQLKEKKPMKSFLTKYITPDVINSPYNQLPVLNSLKDHIFLEKNRFLSMSWLISTLGKLKDQGLRIHLLEEALKKTKIIDVKKIPDEIKSILGAGYPTTAGLLSQSSEICKIYFEEKNLENLVIA
jgi:hypothetical protein